MNFRLRPTSGVISAGRLATADIGAYQCRCASLIAELCWDESVGLSMVKTRLWGKRMFDVFILVVFQHNLY